MLGLGGNTLKQDVDWANPGIGSDLKFAVLLSEAHRFACGVSSIGSLLDHPIREIGTSLSVDRRVSCVLCSHARSYQCGSADERPDYTKPESALGPIRGTLRSIGRLPLGAKIALTVITTWGALGIFWIRGDALLKGRSNIPKGLGYGLLGCAVMFSSLVLFWQW